MDAPAYNYNGQLFDSNLNPIGGMATPYQAEQASSNVQQFQDVRDMQVYPTTTEASLQSKYAVAQQDGNKLLNGGLNIKPPSVMRQMIDMVGGALITYFAARTGGVSGSGAALMALTAAAANHDNDQQLVQRGEIAKKLFNQGGYTEDALYQYYHNGDDSGLKAENQSIAADKRAGIQDQAASDRQDKQIGAQQSLENQRESNQQTLQTQRLNVQQTIANARMNAMGMGNADPSGKFTITGNYTRDHEANVPLQDFAMNYRKSNADLHKAQQADARIDAVNTSTPIGQVAAAYQFLTVEAPSISNSVGTATGVSSEAVNGWSDKINQIIQKGTQRGSFTPEEISEMKDAAHKETAAMKKMAVDSAKSLASGYNMNDLKTATAVSAATGVPASEIIQAQNEEQQTENSLNGSASTAPEGSTVTYEGTTYKTINGKWVSQ